MSPGSTATGRWVTGWLYSLGLQRELVPNVGLTVDYVGNRGRNQSTQIEHARRAGGARRADHASDWRSSIRTAPSFHPSPATWTSGGCWNTKTLDALNSDYDSLEFGLDKRFSNRWSGRVAYTVAKSHDVAPQLSALDARVSNDLDPRMDYGRSNTDNRHAFVTSVNVTPFGGLGVGAIFRYYSGFPINQTTGTDNNGDRDDNDRPVRGVNDAARPIVSELDANGRAVRNGIDGESTKVLDLQVQGIVNLPRSQTVGFFWETYNALNWINDGNGTGERNSSRFLVPDEAGPMRSMQLGVRYTF